MFRSLCSFSPACPVLGLSLYVGVGSPAFPRARWRYLPLFVVALFGWVPFVPETLDTTSSAGTLPLTTPCFPCPGRLLPPFVSLIVSSTV